ncbi:FeoB-associated Cys-rich membrane protein [Vagococcus humatus]|uniref:FeoB-associated Cys-rich membrane protein n=1 Tax=Vagococcus humatus TaxID=1889241 RepID=A0A429Z6M2_9ENTE|nr:FeoB-associated Cys-rich membrane protein [Vagococcus humatus]RST89326.1 FeoB-associated Cys-rich membrane protein [Vagococcus humatus]
MSTLLIGLGVFGFSGYVIYRKVVKKDKKSCCEDCDCAVKHLDK